MNYQALQAILRERFSHGLEFTLNYAYGKALTNSLGNYALNVNCFSGAFQNYYDSAGDWAPPATMSGIMSVPPRPICSLSAAASSISQT